MAKHVEEHTQVQREQLDMICAQQESIDVLKQMLIKLFKKKKKLKTKGPSSRAKGIKVDNSTSEVLMVRMLTLRNHQLHLRRRRVQMLEAITQRG